MFIKHNREHKWTNLKAIFSMIRFFGTNYPNKAYLFSFQIMYCVHLNKKKKKWTDVTGFVV